MCCKDPPPNIELLGPPPKPPWLHFNLDCVRDGIVLEHEGQSTIYPTTGGALFSTSALTIVAVVLFTLAALFLTITVIVLCHRRRLLQKQQVEHKDVPDECQYLYNYKVKGKFWKLPRVRMILRSKIHKNKEHKSSTEIGLDELKTKPESDETSQNEGVNEKSELVDGTYICDIHERPLNSGQKYGSADEHVRNSQEVDGFEKPVLSRQYSSLERGSSTTSGISSDGEWKYQEEPHHYLHQGSPYRVRRLRRKGQRSRHTQDDGDLGDVEGSVECLAKHDKRNTKEKYGSCEKPGRHHHSASDQRSREPDKDSEVQEPAHQHSQQCAQPNQVQVKTQEFRYKLPPTLQSEYDPSDLAQSRPRVGGLLEPLPRRDVQGKEEENGGIGSRGRKKKKVPTATLR